MNNVFKPIKYLSIIMLVIIISDYALEIKRSGFSVYEQM